MGWRSFYAPRSRVSRRGPLEPRICRAPARSAWLEVIKLHKSGYKSDSAMDQSTGSVGAGEAGFFTLASICSEDLNPLFWYPRRAGKPSGWWSHVPFAFWIVAAARPRIIVELGTEYGISYSAFCEAVVRSHLDARCYAIDLWKGDEHAGFYGEEVYADLSAFNQHHYSRFSQLIRLPFDEAVTQFADCTIDLLHIDGLHTYDAVRHDFELWRPKLSARGLVLFHDTNVKEHDFGVWRLWSELMERYPSFEFPYGNGLGVIAVGPEIPSAVRPLISSPSDDVASIVRDRFALIGERWETEWRVQEALNRVTAAQTVETKRAQLQTELDRVLAQLTRLQAEVLKAKTQTAQTQQKAARLHADLLKAKTEAVRAGTLETELSQTRAKLVTDLERQASEIHFLRNQLLVLRELEREHEAVIHSASWRLSAPLRNAGALLPQSMRVGMRRLAKLAFWLVTPWQIPNRLHYLRERRSLRATNSRDIDASDVELLQSSSLFDKDWYNLVYQDVAQAGTDALRHYLQIGAQEGRDPGPRFSTRLYLQRYPDVAAAGCNALVHYIRFGREEGRTLSICDQVRHLTTISDGTNSSA